MDFYSNPFNITVNAGATEGRGNVSIISDNVVEGLETFDIGLASNNSQITLSRDRSEGLIKDSTGICFCYVVYT